MLHGMRLTLIPLGLGCALVALGATIAADDGSTNACTTGEGKPSCTILRPSPPPPRGPLPYEPECIVAVGGLGSDNDDGTFTELLRPFEGDPSYAVHRFGAKKEDPARYPYDTYGSIDGNARSLLRFVRGLRESCSGIHIVAHSMGGDVADRAFSLGLSAADGITSYLPISTPHNGAIIARILVDADDIDDAGNEALRVIAQKLRALGIPAHDITTSAVRDLAEVPRPPRPPRDVAELRQALANDEIALLPDRWSRTHEARDRLPAAELMEQEGHGGSLRNERIRATVGAAIRTGVIPPDDRDTWEKILAFVMSVAFLIVMVILAHKLSEVLIAGILLAKPVVAGLRLVLPQLAEWWIDAFSKIQHGLGFVRGVVTRLRHVMDAIALVEEVGEKTVHVVVDPRIVMVRRLLDRAAQLLAVR